MNKSLATASLLAAIVLGALGCTGKSDIEVLKKVPGPDDQNSHVVPQESGAALGVNVSTNLMKVAVGQQVEVIVDVADIGTAPVTDATAASPEFVGDGVLTLAQGPDVNFVDLQPGESHRFSFIYNALQAGSVTVTARANGTDPSTSWPVGSDPRQSTFIVQNPAQLIVESVTLPASVNMGKTFEVMVKVTNIGEAAALNVTPSAADITGAGTATLVSGPQPASDTIQGGASTTFSYVYQANTAGPIVMGFTAAGSDELSQAAMSADETLSNELRIDTPAALEAMLFLPNAITQNEPFTATLVVTNTGTATAKNVLPNPQLPMTMSVTGTANATAMGQPAPTDIPGGGTAAFSWTFLAQGTGSFHFEVGASGTDANSQDQVDSATVDSGTTQIVPPSNLTITSLAIPGTVNRGTQFTVTLQVKNRGTTTINNVGIYPAAPVVTTVGGANASLVAAPSTKNIAAGQTATFTFQMQENGTAPGSLALAVGARGTDAVSSNTVTATSIQSNLAVVRVPPSITIDSITLPARISRGQTFDVSIVVRNTGGADAAAVLPTPNPLQLTATGGAQVTAQTALNPQTIPGGGTATFTVTYKESGAGEGTLQLNAGATGTDPALGSTISAASKSSTALKVEEPANLLVSSFGMPGAIGFGQAFTLTVTIVNSGTATAKGVMLTPSVPSAIITGGAVVTTQSTISPVDIPGGTNRIFTFAYTQSGQSQGSVQFKVSATGTDANSNLSIAAADKTSVTAAVGPLMGCNGSNVYTGLGDLSLDDSRIDGTVGNDRLRVKEYSALTGEYARVLGSTPTSIQGQGSTFNNPPARWWTEPIASAVTVYENYNAAFAGCLTYTGTATQYGSAPTTATAQTECGNFAMKFWSRPASSGEISSCVNFATTQTTTETNARRRWAYTCATMLTAVPFLTE